MSWTRKSSSSSMTAYKGRHRFEHWYRDNQVYFITARCRERYPAFDSVQAKNVFWNRLAHYTQQHSYTCRIVSLLDNHYHLLGYCKHGDRLGPMMRHIHGSVAKLVNDLPQERRVPFWVDAGHRDYFDGCIRDERQCRRAYRYVLTQSVRHGICDHWRDYAHTRVYIEVDRGVKRSIELGAFLEGVPYKRYGE